MSPMETLALATVVFLLAHYVSSTPLRAGLVAVLGENAYLGLYILVSLAALGWMISAYVRAPYERLWWGEEFRAWVILLMPVSTVLVACGLLTRNPSAVRQEGLLRSMGEPRGILRVTRHPLMWGITLWAVLHVLVRGDAASLVFFGGFLLLAVSGPVLIDVRKKRAIGVDWERFALVSSNVPFAAILAGRNHFKFDEIGWRPVLVGLALYVVLVFLHPYLFGASAY